MKVVPCQLLPSTSDCNTLRVEWEAASRKSVNTLEEGPALAYWPKIWLTGGSNKQQTTPILNYIFQDILAPNWKQLQYLVVQVHPYLIVVLQEKKF